MFASMNRSAAFIGSGKSSVVILDIRSAWNRARIRRVGGLGHLALARYRRRVYSKSSERSFENRYDLTPRSPAGHRAPPRSDSESHRAKARFPARVRRGID